jgi:hypothetical protein
MPLQAMATKLLQELLVKSTIGHAMIKLEMVLQLDNENKVLCLITLVINKYR